jgi:hypothetical protein
MGRAEENMIMGKFASHCSETVRGQEVLDGGMRKLSASDLGPIDIGNGNQAGTCRKDSFYCSPGNPTGIVVGYGIEAKCKNFCELVNAKWANGHREALEEILGIFLLLRFDIE